VIAGMSRPCILSWAKDDGEWWNKHGHPNAGHPYYGPKGVKHITQLSGCALISWEETDYARGPCEYFETDFCVKVIKFLQ